jgi:very-short-patch-repair endonuclease
MKVILEIDGDRHNYNKQHDSVRDQKIMEALGSDWNVVRIKTDYIEQKADLLVEAIEAVVEERNEKKRKAKAFRTKYN